MPQRGPLAAMLCSRLAAVSLKFAGKSATTRKWYFSATLPAFSLYSVIVAYSLRRYIWITFSMCSLNSASRSSIWSRCVQMRRLMSALLVIGKMHQAREILPEPDRIDDGEAEFAGRRGREAGAG